MNLFTPKKKTTIKPLKYTTEHYDRGLTGTEIIRKYPCPMCEAGHKAIKVDINENKAKV